jgi:hypothetical protein
MTSQQKVFTKRVHVFKAGPQISAQGVERNFTPDDLQQAVESYDPGVHEAPLVIGHSGDSDSVPSYGWVKKLVRKGEDLYADVDFTDTAKDLVKKGHYKKLSISFYSPNSPINPHEGKWSVRHLALLGAAPPAIKGLEPFSFSEKEGVFDFSTTFSPKEVFDDELGPTLLVERGPLELLKERLDSIRGEMEGAIEDLEENQEEQTETTVDKPETTNSADDKTAPENPNQQFSEMKKKMGREGAEVSDSAQELEDSSIPPVKEEFEEGVSRKKSKGAHGQKVQVVQEVFEESDEEDMEDMEDEFKELPPALKANAEKMKAKAEMKEEDKNEEDEDFKELPPALKANAEKMKAKANMKGEEGEDEMEFDEVSHKKAKGGKVTFGTHTDSEEDPTGRGETAKSVSGGFVDRMKVGEVEGSDEREIDGSDDGDQEEDRVKLAKDGDQEEDRVKLAKSDSDGGDENSRWADQPEGKKRAHHGDQYDTGEEGLPERNRPGKSDGTDPYGRDGGPTKVPTISEEDPDTEEIAVPLKSTKKNKVVRVLHTESGQKRAETVGGEIADHSEESDGVTRTPKKAKVSNGTDARGRDGGPTVFPTRSEEEPDNMEMAVDLESVEGNAKVRVIRQKSGEKASTDHKESSHPMTKTGKGSTYGQKAPVFEMEEDMEDEEDEDFSESEDFCGMGSMGQAKALGYPTQMFEEFQKQLAELKNENSRLKKDYQEQQTRHRKQKIAEFVDSLYTEGKLTDGIIPQGELQEYCEGLEFGTLEFSEGESPTSKLFGLLDRLPNLVYFGEVVSEGKFQDFESEEDLDPHARALKMVESGECSDYVEAIKRCIPWGSGS